jgi:hypothetical protein
MPLRRNRKRKPKAKHKPDPQRQPTAGDLDPDVTPPGHLTWRMARVDFGGGWGWRLLANGEMERLKTVLTEYETTPLHTLRYNARVREIPVQDVCEEARQRLEELEQNDLESLWELRLGVGDWRAWGILDRSTFDFLWWDPDHTVCTGRDRARGRGRG